MSDGDQHRTAPDQVVEPCAATPSPADAVMDPAMAPGGQAAVAQGCTCSVLANAAFRADAPGEIPFIDPRCPLHALQDR